MDKENNRSAAGLRRSAMAERIRLREEWSALKGVNIAAIPVLSQARVIDKHSQNLLKSTINRVQKTSTKSSSDVLCGVVALVEVGSESRALALRAALAALGATVVPAWSPLVTHLVWAQGGSRGTRAKARALASRLVSPLWVEACAAAARRLPELAFPAAARPSDLPSPKTLRRLLKKAEIENIPLIALLSNSKDSNGWNEKNRLRISSETEQDTSRETDTSCETSNDTIGETAKQKHTRKNRTCTLSVIIEESNYKVNFSQEISLEVENGLSNEPGENERIDAESRVNTAPRRALPATSLTMTPPTPTPKKSRRKLFTQRDAADTTADTDSEDKAPVGVCRTTSKMSQRARKELERAERLARRMVAACKPGAVSSTALTNKAQPGSAPAQHAPRIVLTGMSRHERQIVHKAIQALNGRIQKRVNRKTTHVLLGSCREDSDLAANITGVSHLSTKVMTSGETQKKPRTLNALLGAARGCRVLYGQWALDSLTANRWLHPFQYEVPHLKKITQKARVERSALGYMRSDYAYDVFNGMRVLVSNDTEQRNAAIELLNLCGAVVLNHVGDFIPRTALSQNRAVAQNVDLLQNDRRMQLINYDMKLGSGDGELHSKWVFDSVALSRMRTTRRYLNGNCNCIIATQNTGAK